MDIKMRKAEINLKSLGTGVMLFGAWTFIKLALSCLIYGIGDQLDESLDQAVVIIVNVIVWGFIVLLFLMHLYIGQSARRESEGRRKRAFYLFLTGAVVMINAAAIATEVFMIVTQHEEILTMLITVLIDVTSVAILIELIVNALALRKLRREEAKA